MIFVHAIGAPRYLCTPNTAVEISHVCRRWRILALETSALWSRICLMGDEGLDYVKAYLQRSQSRPFTVVLNFYEYANDRLWSEYRTTEWLNWRPYLELIFPQVHRLQGLAIFTCHSEVIQGVVGFLHNVPAPRLEYLQICKAVNPLDRRAGDNAHPTFILAAPTLTHLRTTNVVLPYPFSITIGLRELYISFAATQRPLSHTDLQSLFSASPALQKLTLGCTPFLRNATDGAAPPLCAPALRHLSLDEVEHSLDILSNIQFPQLVSLELYALSQTRWEELLQQIPVRGQSMVFPKVTRLAIMKMDVNMVSTTLGDAFPALTHLDLHQSEAGPFLNLIATNGSFLDRGGLYVLKPRVWPHLSILNLIATNGSFLDRGGLYVLKPRVWPHLSILTVSKMNAKYDLLSQAVATRQKLGTPIKSLQLSRTLALPFGIVQSLRDMTATEAVDVSEDDPFDDFENYGEVGPNRLMQQPYCPRCNASE
ncbi:unnamed protein product [Somion occarium]|uniref:F-box domain-containing protein n=1 Tax=Somion occarium TaxID=3059160 RepID=A0ABP1D5Q1_9APHY